MRAYIAYALLLSVVLLIPLAGCGSSRDAVFAGDYHILKSGRAWTYDGTYWRKERTRATAEYTGTFSLARACSDVTYAGRPALRVETTVSEVTGDRPAMAEELAGIDYYVLEPTGYYLQAHQTPGGSVEVFSPPRLWLPVPLRPGQTWTWVEEWFGSDATATCTATGMEEEQVPLGTFDAVQVSAGAQASGGGNFLQYTWVRGIAPAIGIVRETRSSYETYATGEQVWTDLSLELRSYSDTHTPPAP
jgi:hypothetical protein